MDTTAAPTARRRRWPAALLAASLLAAAGIGAGGWLLRTEAGAAWALGQVPGLRVDGLQGTLSGPDLSARALHWQGSAGQLDLGAWQLRGLRWQWRPAEGAWLGLQAEALQADSVQWRSAPSSGPTPVPDSLALPLVLDLARWQIGRLQIDQAEALQALAGSGHAGPTEHRLTLTQAQTRQAGFSGTLQLGTHAPLPLQAQVQAHSLDGAATPWQATLQADGPLTKLRARATLRGQAPSGQTAPSLDADAQVQPFSPWPLGALQLRSQALDLSALQAGWPRTALDASVSLAARQAGQPTAWEGRIDNAAAGPWDSARLPLSRLQWQAHWQWADATALLPRGLTLERLQATLPDGGQADATLNWQADTLTLDARLRALHPEALDRRLRASTWSGPLTGQLAGLPALDDWLAGRAALQAQALRGQLTVDWQGRLVGAPATPELGLALDLRADARQLQLQRAELKAGEARAKLSGQVVPEGSGRWQLQLQGGLQQLDPTLWWPLAADSPWRRGPHRLQGQWQAQGRLDTDRLAQASPSQWPLAWQGRLGAELQPSLLAGVPLQGQLTWERQVRSQGTAVLDLAGNRLQARWDGDTEAVGGELGLDAPALAAAAPLLRLLDPAWAPSAGRLQATLSRTPGQRAWRADVQADALQLPGVQLSQGQARLAWPGEPDGPLQLDAQLRGLAAGVLQLDQAQARVDGRLAEHRLSLTASGPARPGELLAQALGTPGGNGTELRLAGQGRWLTDGEGWAGRWQAALSELRLRARGTGSAAGSDWLSTTDLQAELQLDAQAHPLRATLQPGALALPETRLRWRQAEARWRPGRAAPTLALDAQIEPFALAPLLARAQPELGWRGDLRLGGSVQIRREERFDAELVFERLGGDLAMVDDARDPRSRVQPLALSDLRLALSAHDGTWHFTQALAGRALGEMAGVATLQTRPELAWPTADAPLNGVLQLRVANLGAWGAWVPPGWRLGGALAVTAGFGGRFGAPEVTGRLSGERLEARHALMGVQLSDGQVDMRLDGERAHIEQFSFRGGDGRVTLQGEARLGARPELQLQAQAERFQVLGRLDRRLVTSGQATLSLSPERWLLDGALKVDEGLVDVSQGDAPGLDNDVVFASARPASAETAGTARAQRPMQLKAKLDLGERLRIKGRGIDGTLRGELLASVTNQKLSVNGSVRLQDGHYVAYGQNLDIERGVLSFTGPVEDPRLDIFAVRPNLDVTVGVQVTGTALNPRVRLASEPEMSDAYKLSWLMLGREPDGLGEADTALLQRAAVALLAGEGEAPTDAVMKALGLTDFSLRQATDANDVRQMVVSVGKQLSRRWYVGYERGVNATTGTWQLVYRIAQRFTLRAQSGEDNAVDLIWSWRWP
ncbi:translocation/assembly module TamB domain-containing protein [Ideonella sp. 4Y11]|uniref:Translocation/assembly module TamB domain-containing protein n=1 Tax=Ideonella aquatica TaxID=2824119 RepID=A0A941BF01_9BURK|nr:translocation/assembly module TamB domain-containing protein [Ideonella aquatica]MBQ0958241.1 translocation/assembly module TamB domain-containing protein [Ideonella aquatica]